MLENDFYTQDALKINRKCVSNDLNIIVWPLSRIPVNDALLLCSKIKTILYKDQVEGIIINNDTFSKNIESFINKTFNMLIWINP